MLETLAKVVDTFMFTREHIQLRNAVCLKIWLQVGLSETRKSAEEFVPMASLGRDIAVKRIQIIDFFTVF